MFRKKIFENIIPNCRNRALKKLPVGDYLGSPWVKGCNKSIRKIGIEHFLTVFSRFEFIPRVLSKSGESQVGVFVGFVLRTLYSTTGNHLSESVISSYSSSTRVSRQNSPFSYKTICAEKLNFIPRVFFGHSNLNWSRWFEGGFKEGLPPVQNFPTIFRP